jgi:hypothetical protein
MAVKIKTKDMAKRYSDKMRATRYFDTMKQGLKPSSTYHDDPTDTGSLYLKRMKVIMLACVDIIENSSDKELIKTATTQLGYMKDQVPNTVKTWPEKAQAWADQGQFEIMEYPKVLLSSTYCYVQESEGEDAIRFHIPEKLRELFAEVERTDNYDLLVGVKLRMEPITDATRDLPETRVDWHRIAKAISASHRR